MPELGRFAQSIRRHLLQRRFGEAVRPAAFKQGRADAEPGFLVAQHTHGPVLPESGGRTEDRRALFRFGQPAQRGQCKKGIHIAVQGLLTQGRRSLCIVLPIENGRPCIDGGHFLIAAGDRDDLQVVPTIVRRSVINDKQAFGVRQTRDKAEAEGKEEGAKNRHKVPHWGWLKAFSLWERHHDNMTDFSFSVERYPAAGDSAAHAVRVAEKERGTLPRTPAL